MEGYSRRNVRHCRAVALTLGLIGGLGRRTITRALCFLGWQNKDWATSYRVFSRSPWSSAELFTPVLKESVRDWLPAHGPIALALDDTGLPRTGKKIKTAGWQRDPMSPPFHVNLRWGLRFLQASILLPLYRRDPAQSARAVPVRFAECPVVKRPKKNAGDDERAAWRQARKTHNLSTRFVAVLQEQRQRLMRSATRRAAPGPGHGSLQPHGLRRVGAHRLVCRCRAICAVFPPRGQGFTRRKRSPEEVYADRRSRGARRIITAANAAVRQGGARSALARRAGRKSLRLIVAAPTTYRKLAPVGPINASGPIC